MSVTGFYRTTSNCVKRKYLGDLSIQQTICQIGISQVSDKLGTFRIFIMFYYKCTNRHFFILGVILSHSDYILVENIAFSFSESYQELPEPSETQNGSVCCTKFSVYTVDLSHVWQCLPKLSFSL